MSGPRFVLSGLLVLGCLTAAVLAITATQASGSPQHEAAVVIHRSSAMSNTDLPPWLAAAGIAVMLAGVLVVRAARRRTGFVA